jgi:glycine hydroxymethyltransferase
MADFLFRGSLAELDPDVYDLTLIESERQHQKLILIPSESTAPLATREALSAAFQNIYAEGYPDEDTRRMSEAEILDLPARLAHYRRYSDPRYYKGVEYVDIAEALARRRCAELFTTQAIPADDIFVNVQPLSGAPANNAVYTALINPGDTIMGLDLLHGGHLSHGSPANRSGKLYHAVPYTIDPQTEQINYEAIEELARQHKPKIIVAGYSSYPWTVDWARFRAIASAVGAYLMADIAHVAGLVAAGVYPTPVGYADVITFTTHKSLCGPRGACILTTSASLSKKIDRAVFPGEQGGPHANTFVALATAFKLAGTEQFRQFQQQVVENCLTFTNRLKERGFRIPFGGTNTHLMNLDCKSVFAPNGATLSGDQAARILDIAGIVVNRNTIPGDISAGHASGIRMGSSWVTQRGLKQAEMITVADIVADVLKSATPYYLESRKGESLRAKIDFDILEQAKLRVRALASAAGRDGGACCHGYPHFYYRDDPASDVFDLKGDRVRQYLDYALACDVSVLGPGQSAPTSLHTPQGSIDGTLTCVTPYHFRLSVEHPNSGLAATWLRDLSDGYVSFDEDLLRKLPGPVQVLDSSAAAVPLPAGEKASPKPYFVGAVPDLASPLPSFTWQEQASALRRTPVYDVHKLLGGRMVPFAGWEMPVQYTSIVDEHLACRQAAGLFDVTHMGVYQAEGPDAASFLDSVCSNDIGGLGAGESLYTHFLDPDANVIDDTLVYRRSVEKFLVVVNASNDDKDWGWLNAVKDGRVRVDNARPGAKVYGRGVNLRNLRDPKEGPDMRVDIALQGPKSRDILLSLECDPATRKRIMALKRTELCDAIVGDFDLVVSRTGYTGEKMAFELFVHPDRSADLFKVLLQIGGPLGIKPCGLGARDSLRTEAGLPLYGHEMGAGSGRHDVRDLGVAEAGFGSYVKTYKPWFIGREAFLEREKTRKGVVARFRFPEKGVRVAHNSDPMLDKRGRMVGYVTSCALDNEGFLTGQAFVEMKSAEEGTPVFIYQSASKEAGKPPAELKNGDRAVLPTPAVIVSRFPK